MISGITVHIAVALAPLCLHGADQESVDALIKKLGSPHFRVRESATQGLLKKWPDAIPALKKALGSADPEVANRAAAILEKFDRRPLGRIQRFVKEGKLDLAVEILARLPRGKYETESWRAVCALAAPISKSRIKPGVKSPSPLPPPPFALAPRVTDPRLTLAGQRVTKDTRTPSAGDERRPWLFARADEVDLQPERRAAFGGVFVTSGRVRIRSFVSLTDLIFALGPVRLRNCGHTIIVSDGDVTVDGRVSSSVIVARGRVKFKSASESRIISGKTVTCTSKHLSNCKILEHQTTPLGWIHFFDPAEEGITVAKAKTGVAVAKLAAKKRFAKAGLRKGDILTKIDTDAVDSPETFRRLLRRHVAWEEEMTFHVRRDGKKLQVRIPRGE